MISTGFSWGFVSGFIEVIVFLSTDGFWEYVKMFRTHWASFNFNNCFARDNYFTMYLKKKGNVCVNHIINIPIDAHSYSVSRAVNGINNLQIKVQTLW